MLRCSLIYLPHFYYYYIITISQYISHFFLATRCNFLGEWGSQRGAVSRPGKEMKGRRCFYSSRIFCLSLNMCFRRSGHSPAVPLPFGSLIFLCHLLPSAFVQAYFSASSPRTVVIKHLYRQPSSGYCHRLPFFLSLSPTSSAAHPYVCVSEWASIPRARC